MKKITLIVIVLIVISIFTVGISALFLFVKLNEKNSMTFSTKSSHYNSNNTILSNESQLSIIVSLPSNYTPHKESIVPKKIFVIRTNATLNTKSPQLLTSK
jgi:hypothetical protein